MARIQTPRVQVDVQAWTPQGVHYHRDLMGDLTTIQTSKPTTQPFGTFTLTLTMREDSHGSWADKLPYRTYVEIRAGLGLTSEPPILMRGLIDAPGQTLQAGAWPNGPTREVTISGRDLGAILHDWQILYLWGIDPMATYFAAHVPNGGNALSEQLGINTGQTAPTALLQAFLNKLVNGTAVHGLQSVIPQIPAMRPHLFIPPAYQINFLSLQPWQGSYSNFVDYFASPPWGEDFVFDAPDAPYLVVRQTPYKNYVTGNYPLPYGGTPTANGFFVDAELAAGIITSHDLTINGSGAVYTYYVTTPDLASSVAQSYAQFFYVYQGGQPVHVSSSTTGAFSAPTGSTAKGVQEQVSPQQARQPGSNPYFDAARAKLWGIQPLKLTTPWVSTLQSTFGTNAQKQVAAMNTWLVNVYGDNDKFVSGTITCHGNPAYTVGRYVVVEPGAIASDPRPWEAYIEQVDSQIDIASDHATWTMDLGVVRGRLR